MLNLDRIELLKGYCIEEPQNPFNYYALALEFREFEKAAAADLFNYVVTNFPNYLPVFFPAAHFFFENGDLIKAKKIFESGIELADTLQDEKAKKELTNAYQNFLFETDLD
ncbi:MAG: tetratricopeptide repeat protein [Bacteroidetes bacterium]|nr:tetratricopeptide repeat protein [Bacteroidota bacterium]MDA1268741.1 tetratricopeptide repeat protein [Bacteroidota bacterium]